MTTQEIQGQSARDAVALTTKTIVLCYALLALKMVCHENSLWEGMETVSTPSYSPKDKPKHNGSVSLLAYLQSSGEGGLNEYEGPQSSLTRKKFPRWLMAFPEPQRWSPPLQLTFPSLYTLGPPETPKAMYNLGRITYSWLGGVGGTY